MRDHSGDFAGPTLRALLHPRRCPIGWAWTFTTWGHLPPARAGMVLTWNPGSTFPRRAWHTDRGRRAGDPGGHEVLSRAVPAHCRAKCGRSWRTEFLDTLEAKGKVRLAHAFPSGFAGIYRQDERVMALRTRCPAPFLVGAGSACWRWCWPAVARSTFRRPRCFRAATLPGLRTTCWTPRSSGRSWCCSGRRRSDLRYLPLSGKPGIPSPIRVTATPRSRSSGP